MLISVHCTTHTLVIKEHNNIQFLFPNSELETLHPIISHIILTVLERIVCIVLFITSSIRRWFPVHHSTLFYYIFQEVSSAFRNFGVFLPGNLAENIIVCDMI